MTTEVTNMAQLVSCNNFMLFISRDIFLVLLYLIFSNVNAVRGRGQHAFLPFSPEPIHLLLSKVDTRKLAQWGGSSHWPRWRLLAESCRRPTVSAEDCSAFILSLWTLVHCVGHDHVRWPVHRALSDSSLDIEARELSGRCSHRRVGYE